MHHRDAAVVWAISIRRHQKILQAALDLRTSESLLCARVRTHMTLQCTVRGRQSILDFNFDLYNNIQYNKRAFSSVG